MNTAVYIRVSTQEQRTDSQEQELKRYCKQRGWNDFLRGQDLRGQDQPSGTAAGHPSRNDRETTRLQARLDGLRRSLTHLALILDELNRMNLPLIASSQGLYL